MFLGHYLRRFSTLGVLLCSSALCSAESNQLDFLREKAEQGNPAAQLELANEYFFGSPNRKANYTLAAHWYLVCAERGDKRAMFNYALCLERGLGVERDPFAAAEWFAKAAEDGTILPAVYNHALILLNGIICHTEAEQKKMPANFVSPKNEEKGMDLLRELSKKDFAPAKVELAERILRRRKLTQVEMDSVFQMLDSAAKDPAAPVKTWRLLADCYYGGVGVKANPQKMIECLKRSAKGGDLEGIAKLAYCFEHAINIEYSPKKAFELYRQAALNGMAEAQYKYAEGIEKGMESGKTEQDAISWYLRAARQKHALSFLRLADMAEEGIGMEVNEKAAVEYLFQAAKLGNSRAQYRVGRLFLKEKGIIPYDPAAAVYWFKQAAIREEAAAQRMLAICYYEGKGCEKNTAEADKWLKKAVDNGDLQAQRMLMRDSRSAW